MDCFGNHAWAPLVALAFVFGFVVRPLVGTSLRSRYVPRRVVFCGVGGCLKRLGAGVDTVQPTPFTDGPPILMEIFHFVVRTWEGE